VGVEVAKPKGQQTSMTRRLFSQAAPVAGGVIGGIFGGPAGAAAGSALGGTLGAKVGGADNQQALGAGMNSGIESGLGGLMGGGAKTPAAGPAASVGTMNNEMRGQTLQPMVADNAFSRKLTASQSNPQIAANEGLGTLSQLPPGHPLREQYTAPLVRMQMMSQRRTPVGVA
jgi:hypothetical protein